MTSLIDLQSAASLRSFFNCSCISLIFCVPRRPPLFHSVELMETILVVEDDPDLRTYVADVLRDLNYRVLSAGTAQAALTILLQQDEQVNLLLTDVVMPGINGRELGR